MDQPGLIRRASRKALSKLRRSLSRDTWSTRDDQSSISQRSGRSSFSTLASSLFTTTTTIAEHDDEYKPADEPISEDPERESPPDYHQGQSVFFRKLPPEIRDQIYREYFVASGVERHVFLIKARIHFSPCVTRHDAPDERQVGLARDFEGSGEEVQYHPEWFDRLQSTWCNHWRCEKLWQDIQAGREVDYNRGTNQGFMGLLLSCKRMYEESVEHFRESKVLNITDGPTFQRIIKSPRPSYLQGARYINLSLRRDSGSWLYLNSVAVWHIIRESGMGVRRLYIWLDAECPLTRRLLTEFRELYNNLPDDLADRVVIDFPCDAEDGFWAWGEGVERETFGQCLEGGVGVGGGGRPEKLPALVPKFRAVGRGRPRFNETSWRGFVTSQDAGRPRPRVLTVGNPFEDMQLYGKEIFADG
ncbi:hypothetical protein CPLU01_15252 [Colletotrichum plurivorum]|uniref:DUF7730 domain-containing protein n=1 Tax=Colletotrichum plurivorum TaxID=2175906 RepID=A0A8H6MWE7_9PEZI|nr:hypothetical protein CPLU01_15252 [Colletotrichum plurivorum]